MDSSFMEWLAVQEKQLSKEQYEAMMKLLIVNPDKKCLRNKPKFFSGLWARIIAWFCD